MSVIVLFGGDGSEHRVSVASAQNVAHHLPDARFWFLERGGGLVSVSRTELISCSRPFEEDFAPEALGEWPTLSAALESSATSADVLFLALHGGSGENGTLQSELESRGLPFTGSGARASRLAFDKLESRDIASTLGVRVADACPVEDSASGRERLSRLLAEHGKIVIKPVSDGSSHGVLFVDDEQELGPVWDACARRASPHLLAEAFISGRELTAGVMDRVGGGPPVALPCSEVRLDPGRAFDYEGKYLGKGAVELTPAPVPASMAEAAQAVARRVHEAIGCRGYSRTDVIVDETGPVFLEINTLPGLTAASFIPQQLAAASIPFDRFLREQIELARVSGSHAG